MRSGAYPRLTPELPDEDELEIDGSDGESVDDVLIVEALMGWDGDRCRCEECLCPRYLDGTDPDRCSDCVEGRHWFDVIPKS